MLPATGALIEGEGPGDGCSRATRDFIGMLRVLESVVRHPTGFVCLFKVNIGDSTPEPAADYSHHTTVQLVRSPVRNS